MHDMPQERLSSLYNLYNDEDMNSMVIALITKYKLMAEQKLAKQT